jgi:hypothetical protein
MHLTKHETQQYPQTESKVRPLFWTYKILSMDIPQPHKDVFVIRVHIETDHLYNKT